jgi:hypothetical protein
LADFFAGTQTGNGHGQIPVRQVCTVLYSALPPLRSAQMQAALTRTIGPSTVEWANMGVTDKVLLGGVAAFGEHRVAMIALDVAVRPEVLEVTVGVSPMPEDQRDLLLNHSAAIRLLYIGDAIDPIEQLTALYTVAGMLLIQGGLGIINERAALAVPIELAVSFLPQLGSEVPPISLWTGVVTFGMGDAGAPGRYLMRTYGMDQCLLPELAIYLKDRELADAAYHTLINTCLHLVQSRTQQSLGVGDRVEFNNRTFLLTDPNSTASEFASETGIMLLVEV